jgi:hypothetical protein
MRWFRPNLRSSLYGLLGPTFTSSQSMDKSKTDEIRDKMLDQLGAAGALFFPHTAQRLRHAPDVDDLWHLRPNLMAALAAMHGEDSARTQVATLTVMFDGLLPRGHAGRRHDWRYFEVARSIATEHL